MNLLCVSNILVSPLSLADAGVVDANGGDTEPYSPTAWKTYLLEETAAEMETSRKAKGEVRALSTGPVTPGVMPEWWKDAEEIAAQVEVAQERAVVQKEAGGPVEYKDLVRKFGIGH